LSMSSDHLGIVTVQPSPMTIADVFEITVTVVRRARSAADSHRRRVTNRRAPLPSDPSPMSSLPARPAAPARSPFRPLSAGGPPPPGTRPPGPPLPRWLQTLGFVVGGARFLEAVRRRYGDVVTLGTTFDERFVLVFSPELVRRVFQGSPAE